MVLKGISWNHSRAFPPLVATAQRFEELHPGVRIRWEKRSLDEFGHADLGPLAQQFDLQIVDHPMMGSVCAENTLLDLTPLVPPDFLAKLASDTVGGSFESYRYRGKLFALPVDAAAPGACYRPDLLSAPPVSWEEMLDLAESKHLIMPCFPADLFLNFLGLCVSCGAEPAGGPGQFMDREIGMEALAMLKQLTAHLPEAVYDWNPIAVYEELSSHSHFVYCPFAYTYSNYSREGFARYRLEFANPVPLPGGDALRTVLGGTGIAISTTCQHVETAADYVLFTTEEACQRTIYVQAGGQPARRSAWSDPLVNRISHDFFERTLESVETAYVRPRHRGYVQFQAEAGVPIADYLRRGGNPLEVLHRLDSLWDAHVQPGMR